MENAVAFQLVSVLATGTVLVALCQCLRLSPILGYLASGVLVGPAALGWLSEGPTTRLLAELGVTLLLFTIGLEISLQRLLAAKRLVLGLGGAQVLACVLVFGGAAWSRGRAPEQALVLGAALAMSSTAIVLKHLGEQMELPTPHGRVMTGILLFQDFATIPILVMLPVLAAHPVQLGGSLALALFKAALVLLVLVLAGRRLLPPLLHWIASTRSLELFMLSALLMAVAAAGLSSLAGLSGTLGAFMAGMLLGETPFRHQIEADIRPFRDLMLGVFFVTIGMQLDPTVFVASPVTVALVLAGAVLVKPLLLVPLVRAFGQTKADAWRASVGLAQGGEFGLLVVSAALARGVLETHIAQPVLGGLILSMLLAPVALRLSQPISYRLSAGGPMPDDLDAEARIAERSKGLHDHVIICGYGRLGQNLRRILFDADIPVLALDVDPARVRQAAAAGEPAMYGHASQPGVLRAAGVERARALAITCDDAGQAERIVGHTRNLRLELPVLVRNTRGRYDRDLSESGATIFPEALETSLAFASQLLILLDMPPSEVEARINAIRAQDYAGLRTFFHDSGESGDSADAQDYPEQVFSIVVGEGHWAAGRTLQELDLAGRGVELLDIRRGAVRVPARLLDTRVRAGDVLTIKGDSGSLDKAVARLSEGA